MGEVQELRFDGDYVVAVKDIEPGKGQANSKFVTSYTTNWDDEEVYDVNYINNETLDLKGRTLQSATSAGADNNDQGWTIASTSMPTVLRHVVNGSTETINYSSMGEALAAAGDALPNTEGKQFDGRIVMVLNDQGVAQWAFIESDTPVTTGQGGGYVDNSHGVKAEATINGFGGTIVSLSVDRPAYIPASSDVDVDFNIYVNGKLAASDTATILGNTERVIANGGVPYYVASSVNDTVTVDITDVDYDDVYVRYINGDTGAVIAQTTTASGNFMTAPTASVTTAAGQTVTFNLRSVSGDTLNYTIEQGGTTILAGQTLVLGTSETSDAFAANDSAYVDVVIDGLNSAKEAFTVTGFSGTLAAMGNWAGYGSTETIAAGIYDGSYDANGNVADGDTATLWCSTTLRNNQTKTGLIVTLGDKNDSSFTWDVCFANNNKDYTSTGSLTKNVTVTGDMELYVKSVKLAPEVTATIALLGDADNDGLVDANETVRITFSEPVVVDTASTNITHSGTGFGIGTLTDSTERVNYIDVTVTALASSGNGTITIASGALTSASGTVNGSAITFNIDSTGHIL